MVYSNYNAFTTLALAFIWIFPHISGTAVYHRILVFYDFDSLEANLVLILSICIAIVIGVLGGKMYPSELMIPPYMYEGVTLSLLVKSIVFGILYCIICNIIPNSQYLSIYTTSVAFFISYCMVSAFLPNMLDAFVFMNIQGAHADIMIRSTGLITLGNILGILITKAFYDKLYDVYDDYAELSDKDSEDEE